MNNLPQLQELLNLDAAGVIFILSIGYLGVSIVIELIHILVLFTPSRRDDMFVEHVKEKWKLVSKYISWFSVKTPASAVLKKTLSMLGYLREDLDKVKKK